MAVAASNEAHFAWEWRCLGTSSQLAFNLSVIYSTQRRSISRFGRKRQLDRYPAVRESVSARLVKQGVWRLPTVLLASGRFGEVWP